MAENGELSFEEGFAWLASDILDDPLYDPNEDKLMNQKQQHNHHHHHYQKLGRLNMLMEPVLQRPRLNHRPKSPTWASRGSGMQAIFLESGQKTCGTGVFIPRSKKPACSPVLLPARVVQALNLNVHALGLQVSPNKDTKGNMNKAVRDVKCENDVSSTKSSVHCCAISRTSSSSADVFLPKEWTY